MDLSGQRPLILATDQSEPARRAAREGLALAEALGTPAVLVSVVTPLHQGVEETRAELEEVRAKLTTSVALDIEVERAISVEAGIFQAARRHEAPLIVIGTHGRTGLRHALVGSSAERIVQLSERPVLTVRPTKDGDDATVYLSRHARILCPTDFSDASRDAMLQAAELAKRLDAELLLVHVVEPILVPDAYGLPAAQVAVNLSEDLRKGGETALADIREKLGVDGLKVAALVEEGVAWRRITALAESEDVDLVFMATKGLTGLEHFLLGSTAERVVRHCSRPVLSFKSVPDDSAS